MARGRHRVSGRGSRWRFTTPPPCLRSTKTSEGFAIPGYGGHAIAISRAGTTIIAHRGGSARLPENSAAAFRDTLTLGVDQVEFDVQLTSDGVPVIFHDATLERVTDGAGAVAETSLAALKRLTIKDDGGRILTLEELIALLTDSDLILRCEFKSGVRVAPTPELLEKSLALLDAAGLLARTLFTGFHLPTVARLRRDVPGSSGVAWLVARQLVSLIGGGGIALLAQDADIGSVSMHHSQVDGEMLNLLRDGGIELGVFGLLAEADIARMLELPVGLLTTDRPGLAVRLREARRRL